MHASAGCGLVQGHRSRDTGVQPMGAAVAAKAEAGLLPLDALHHACAEQRARDYQDHLRRQGAICCLHLSGGTLLGYHGYAHSALYSIASRS